MPIALFLLGLLPACDDSPVEFPDGAVPTVTFENRAQDLTVFDGERFPLGLFVVDTDTQKADIVVELTANGRRLCLGTPTASGYFSCDVSIIEGDTPITATATDPDGHVGTAELSPTVIPSTPPTAQILSPSNDYTWVADQRFEFTALVGDNEESPEQLEVSLESDLDGELAVSRSNSQGSVVSGLRLSAGTHNLTLRVTDTSRRTTEASTRVVMNQDRQAPECDLTEPIEEWVPAGAPIDLAGTVSDDATPIDALTLRFGSTLQGEIDIPTADTLGNVRSSGVVLDPGQHTLQLVAIDLLGRTCISERIFTADVPPIGQISVPIANSLVRTGEPVVVEANVDDVETPRAALEVSWASDVDGPLDGPTNVSSSGTLQGTLPPLSPGPHVLTLTVTDSRGLQTEVTTQIVSDQPPVPPVVSIGPLNPTTLDELTVTIDEDAVDPEGSPVSYITSWSRLIGGLSVPGTTLPNGVTNRGDVWTVSVFTDDGTGLSYGPPGQASITIINAPPFLNSASLFPDPPNALTGLSCIASGDFDPDGDDLIYTATWFGGSLTAGTTNDYLPGDQLVRGEQMTCELTVSDGALDSPTVTSNTVTVVNAPPFAPELAITPTRRTTRDDLTCEITAQEPDADGDPLDITLTWEHNGAPWTGTLLSQNLPGDTIPGLETVIGDQFTCTVIVNDGFENSEAAHASATVQPGWGAQLLTVEAAEWQFEGMGAQDLLGQEACALASGDFDDDGFADVVFSSSEHNGAGFDSGEVYMVLASDLGEDVVQTVDDGASLRILGDTTGDEAGSCLGVLNSMDGVAGHELIVGVPFAQPTVANAGQVSIFTSGQLGASTLTVSDAAIQLDGTVVDGLAGTSIAALDDIDGDGQQELAIGEPGSGRIFIMSSADLDNALTTPGSDSLLNATWILTTELLGDGVGTVLASAGDMNGDGHPELLVGAPTALVNGVEKGAVYVVDLADTPAGETSLSNAWLKLEGVDGGEATGASVAGLGDIDGDGLSDISIGAPSGSGDIAESGVAYILSSGSLPTGGAIDLSLADVQLWGAAFNNGLGTALSSIGDLDGDGLREVLVGAPRFGEPLDQNGVMGLLLSDTLALDPTWSLSTFNTLFHGESAFDQAGHAILGIGDVDGDGLDDFLVSSPDAAGVEIKAGKVYLFLGLPFVTL